MDSLLYFIPLLVLFLAVRTAYYAARQVYAPLKAKGSQWAMVTGILAFLVSLSAILVMIGLATAVTGIFGR